MRGTKPMRGLSHRPHQGQLGAVGSVPEGWNLNYRSPRLQLRFHLEMTRFKHVGIFPEQAANWEYIAEHLQPGDKFLNLFAYTGGASIAARSVGAEVTMWMPSAGGGLDAHQHGIERP